MNTFKAKSKNKLFKFVLSIVLVTIQPAQIALARANLQPIPSTPAESYLLETLREGYYADLAEAFPNEDDRYISGDFFVQLLKDDQIQMQQEIAIAGAIFSDFIYANNIKIPYSIYMDNCTFLDLIEFSSADFEDFSVYNSTFSEKIYFNSAGFDDVTFTNSTFKADAYFVRIQVSGTMNLGNNIFEQRVSLYGANIENDFFFSGSQVLGLEASGDFYYPAEFWSMTVGHTADLSNALFEGDAMFASSNFHTVYFYNAVFNGNTDFSLATVDRKIDFNNSTFAQNAGFTSFKAEDASFKGSVLGADVTFDSASLETLSLDDAIFNGSATFQEISINRYADINRTQFNGPTDFNYSNIGYGYFYGAIFNDSVNFYQMEIEGDAEFDGAEFNGSEVSAFNNVSIADMLSMSGIIAPAGFDFSYSDFGTLVISGKEIINIPTINLSQTEIGKLFSIENVTSADFNADGLNVGGSVILKNIAISDNLDLRNTQLGFMVIDNFTWPGDPGAFNMRGMHFSDIDMGEEGLTDDTWKGLLLLVNQSAYSPQAYQALAQFLTDKGHPDWAAEVDVAMNRRERSEVLQAGSAAWLWSWFMDGFSNYGAHPEFAFIWSGFVVAVGAFVFRRKEDMLPFEQEDVPVEYNPIWYSFALFIPYVELGIASKWEPNPERKWARYYKYVHMLLGWILMPIALLTFGGIIG